jgi:hypothetical protein
MHFMKLHIRYLDEMRRVYFTRVSAQLGFVTGIKQQPLPQLVTSHVKMTISLGPQGTLVTGTKTKLVPVKSISETRVVNLRLRCLDEWAMLWGPPVNTGNRLLRYRYFVGMFVTGVPIEARYSVISVCNEL